MIDLRSLEVFFWVVKLGGFRRAAERLRTTQPAISARIGQLETHFDTRLLDRSPSRAAVPTAKGQELFAYAERMLALRSELETRLSSDAGRSGIVRIGVAETLVHTMLGSLIRRLNALYPNVTPEITVDISPSLQSMLLGGDIDIALLLGAVNDPRARTVPLAEHALIWVASPTLHIGTERLTIAQLARWPILSYARGTQPHAHLAALFARPDVPHARIFTSSSLASIVSMAADGIGIGVVPETVARTECALGRLVRLSVEAELPALRFSANYLAAADDVLAAAIAGIAATL